MRRTTAALRIAAGAVLALALVGCGVEDDVPDPEPGPAEPEETEEAETEPDGTDDDEPEELDPAEPEETDDGSEQAEDDPRVAQATQDLTERAGVDAAAVEVLSYEQVTWPDGSIGCPEEGMSYTQALVEGYRLVLVADEQEYHYHASGDEEFSYCASPTEPVTGTER